MPPWTVVVADDETLMREALALFLDSSGEFEVIGQASDGAEATTLALRLRPDVVLMGLRMPGTSGLEGIARLAAAWPEARIVAVTTITTADAVVAALRAGAQGYVLKDSSRADLVAGVRAVAEGRAALSGDVVASVIDEVRRGAGPDRGLRREAAVKARCGRLMGKLGVVSRVQVVVRACELGLVEPRLR
ncbi:response regulator [Mariniluteicoccus flavus]